MVFQNRMMSTVIDRFGNEVMATPTDKSHFKVTVPVAVSPQFYGWVFGLGDTVMIDSPAAVREGFKEYLAKICKRYEEVNFTLFRKCLTLYIL